jgi:hypothetical protein
VNSGPYEPYGPSRSIVSLSGVSHGRQVAPDSDLRLGRYNVLGLDLNLGDNITGRTTDVSTEPHIFHGGSRADLLYGRYLSCLSALLNILHRCLAISHCKLASTTMMSVEKQFAVPERDGSRISRLDSRSCSTTTQSPASENQR